MVGLSYLVMILVVARSLSLPILIPPQSTCVECWSQSESENWFLSGLTDSSVIWQINSINESANQSSMQWFNQGLNDYLTTHTAMKNDWNNVDDSNNEWYLNLLTSVDLIDSLLSWIVSQSLSISKLRRRFRRLPVNSIQWDRDQLKPGPQL